MEAGAKCLLGVAACWLATVQSHVSVLLAVGLGAGVLPMRLKQLRPDLEVEAVELDPEVVRLAREWLARHLVRG